MLDGQKVYTVESVRKVSTRQAFREVSIPISIALTSRSRLTVKCGHQRQMDNSVCSNKLIFRLKKAYKSGNGFCRVHYEMWLDR